ncbi:MAG: diguanylate cyclase [Gammaproteobacteria bacterium]|nr:diguanylate cyclase [Gammaproteobacteria bacterium]
MTNEISLDNKTIQIRLANDLAQRIKVGVFIYPVLWFCVGLGSEFHKDNLLLFIIINIIFALTSVIRAIHLKRIKKISHDSSNLWLLQVRWLLLPHTVLWGSIFALSLTSDNNTFALLMTFTTAGIVPGGIYNFAPDFKLTMWFTFSIATPALISTAIIGDWFLFILLIVYLVYIVQMVKSQNKDYWFSLKNELRLKKQTRTDPLTQLENRRSFDEKLNKYCHLTSRNHELLTILLIDCDHFKNVNDKFGHDVGDLCLKQIAKLLTEQLPRATDVCARYGGEEFSLILPGTDLVGAKIVAERLRANLESNPIEYSEGQLQITVSIGAVSRKLRRFKEGLPEELFKQADLALYKAKKNGRNCCVHFAYDENEQEYKQAISDADFERLNF